MPDVQRRGILITGMHTGTSNLWYFIKWKALEIKGSLLCCVCVCANSNLYSRMALFAFPLKKGQNAFYKPQRLIEAWVRDTEATTMWDQPLTPHLTMKWKPNRRQQFIAGQDAGALPLPSFSLPFPLWLFIERLHISNLTDSYSDYRYLHSLAQRWGHEQYTHPTHTLYIETDQHRHEDVYCINTNSHNLPYSAAGSLWLRIFQSKPL